MRDDYGTRDAKHPVPAGDKSGTAVPEAQCTVESPRGNWNVVTPGNVMVVRWSDHQALTGTKVCTTPTSPCAPQLAQTLAIASIAKIRENQRQ